MIPPPMNVNVAQLFQPSPATALPAIDPKLKELGRLWIDFNYIVHTNGVDRYRKGHPHPPSICMLYQKGSCNADVKCNQIHVQKIHMRAIRKCLQAQPFSNCCYGHGDLASGRRDFQSLLQLAKVQLRDPTMATPIDIPVETLSITAYWEAMLASSALVKPVRKIQFTSQKVCNLHQTNSCRFGTDCKNIHICREFWVKLKELTPFYTSLSPVPEAMAGPESHFHGPRGYMAAANGSVPKYPVHQRQYPTSGSGRGSPPPTDFQLNPSAKPFQPPQQPRMNPSAKPFQPPVGLVVSVGGPEKSASKASPSNKAKQSKDSPSKKRGSPARGSHNSPKNADRMPKAANEVVKSADNMPNLKIMLPEAAAAATNSKAVGVNSLRAEFLEENKIGNESFLDFLFNQDALTDSPFSDEAPSSGRSSEGRSSEGIARLPCFSGLLGPPVDSDEPMASPQSETEIYLQESLATFKTALLSPQGQPITWF